MKISLCALVVVLVGILPAAASPVVVSVGDERGRGLARVRGAECFVVVPTHVVSKARRPGAVIDIIGPGGALGKAVFAAVIGSDNDDVSMLRLTQNEAQICSEHEQSQIKAHSETALVLREGNGGLTFVPINILYKDRRTLSIGSTSEFLQLSRMMSGATLIEGGVEAGLLLSVSTGSQQKGEVRSLEYVSGLIGSWVKGSAADMNKVGKALEIITQAISMRPLGDIGQVAAAEQMVEAGIGLPGADLQGLSFRFAAFNNGKFSETRFRGADLRDASFADARLDEADLALSLLQGAVFKDALIQDTRFYFATLDKANFEGAMAVGSNWIAASAPDASFHKADLTGANFAFADLRGANFTGANLTDAIFIGANVEGATFDQAIIKRTDFSSAIGNATGFSEGQKLELCASMNGRRYFSFELMRVVPSTKYSSGLDFDQRFELPVVLTNNISLLKRCENREASPSGFDPVYRYKEAEFIREGFRLDIRSGLFDNAGRGRKYEARMRERVRTIDAWLKSGTFIEVEDTSHASLTTALTAKVKDTRLPAPAHLSYETLFLIFLNRHPEILGTHNWRSIAERWLEVESRYGDKPRAAHIKNVWPKFFPEGTSPQSLRARDIELFKLWTQNRAADLPNNFVVELKAPRELSRFFYAGKNANANADTSYRQVNTHGVEIGKMDQSGTAVVHPLISFASRGSTQNSLQELDDAADNVNDTMPLGIKVLGAHVANLKFKKSLDTFQVELSAQDMTKLAAVSYPNVRISVHLLDTSVKEASDGSFASTLHVKLIALDFSDGNGQSFPQ